MPDFLHCPHCDKPMKWLGGNAIFSFWRCLPCQKEYSFNVWLEEFDEEVDVNV